MAMNVLPVDIYGIMLKQYLEVNLQPQLLILKKEKSYILSQESRKEQKQEQSKTKTSRKN